MRATQEELLLGRVFKDLAFLAISAITILYVLQFSLNYPMDLPFLGLDPGPFFMNVSVIFALLLSWSFLIDARALSVLSIAAAAGFGWLNYRKMLALGAPIEPLDFYNLQISPVLLKYLGAREAAIFVGLLFLPLLGRFVVNRFWKRHRRGTVAFLYYQALTLTFVLFFLFVCAEPFRAHSWLLDRFPPHPDHADAARRFGYPLSTILNLPLVQVFHPHNYSRDVIGRIVRQVPPVDPPPTPPRSVVLVLLESFRDYAADGVKYREEVIPFYRELKKESQVGRYFSPVVGGGTANVEYEVLTGLPVAFLPVDSIPYEQYLENPAPSVVAFLARDGFATYAVHNNFGTYYNRNHVFANFHFHKFYSLEELRREAGLASPSTFDDRHVFAKSLELLSPKNAPVQFHYLVTIDTHGPYDKSEPGKNWLDDPVIQDPSLVRSMNVYADRQHRLDETLRWYFGELKKLKNPPVVILFGDHHPSMSLELPFATKGGPHRVEGVIWNGDPGLGYASEKAMPCLAPLVLRAARVPMTRFFHFVEKYCSDHKFNAPIAFTGENARDLADYEILGYDRMFGEKFSVNIPAALRRPPHKR